MIELIINIEKTQYIGGHSENILGNIGAIKHCIKYLGVLTNDGMRE